MPLPDFEAALKDACDMELMFKFEPVQPQNSCSHSNILFDL